MKFLQKRSSLLVLAGLMLVIMTAYSPEHYAAVAVWFLLAATMLVTGVSATLKKVFGQEHKLESILLTSLILYLLAANSLGQLSWTDVITVGFFAAITLFMARQAAK